MTKSRKRTKTGAKPPENRRDPKGARIQVGMPFDLDVVVEADPPPPPPNKTRRELLLGACLGLLQGAGALALRDLVKRLIDEWFRHGQQ